jgi:class 3 adenylate cyclase
VTQLTTFFTLLLLLSTSLICSAQETFFRQYDVHDGLASATVYDILQDNQQFLWFCTEAGVSRFDGLRFEQWSTDEGLADNEVFRAYQDDQERIWFMPFNGQLTFYKNHRIVHPGVDSGLSVMSVNGYFTDLLEIDSFLFFGTTRNKLLLTSPGGYQAFHLQGKTLHLISWEDLQLTYWDGQLVRSAHFEVTGDSLVLKDEGIVDRTFKPEPTPLYSIPKATDSLIDHEGNVWYTTLGDGVWMKSANPVSYLDQTNGLNGKHIHSVGVHDQQLIVGYENGTVDYIEDGEARLKRITEGDYNRVLSLNWLEGWFAGSDRGLFNLENGENQPGLRAIKCAIQHQNALLVGTFNGLYRVSSGSRPQKLFAQRTLAVAVHEDTAWIGTNNGLYYLDLADSSGTARPFPTVSSRVKELAFLPSGDLVIGTHGEGLLIRSGGRIFRFDEEDGLKSDMCNALTVEGDHTFWMGTNHGLHRIRFEPNPDLPHPIAIDHFNEENGLISNYVTDVEIYGGKVVAGTDKGLSFFSLLQPNQSEPPQVYIAGLTVNGRDTALKSGLRLHHTQNTLSLEFSAIAFGGGMNTRFKHRLVGGDGHWEISQQGKVNYEALQPGHYRFEVVALNSDNQESVDEASFNFTIQAPFWQKTWFIVLLCIAGLIGVALLVRTILKYRHRKDLEEKNKLLAEKNRLIEASKQRSEELLLNILPKTTAQELMENGKVAAKDHTEVGVMFSDFKDFTRIAEAMDPAELVNELDYCFRKFDAITVKYRIEKIKTIGDAYMCATGLTENNTQEVEELIRAAIEIRDFMEEYRRQREAEGRPAFGIRIGIHTGHVVSGVVGIRKFAFDIWGDAVNVAARMESSGEVGKINISEPTYEKIKNRFECSSRGMVEAKGKGSMKMYYVLNARQ